MTTRHSSRRDFIRKAGILAGWSGLLEAIDTSAIDLTASSEAKLFFKISLAEWSFHKSLEEGKLTNLEFPVKAKRDFGIDAVDYVNVFFMDKAKDQAYLTELKNRCSDNGVSSLLIMIDREGDLADTDASRRKLTVENHYKWVEAARFLGCHSIRVNCAGVGTPEEVAKAGIEGLRSLSEFAKQADIQVIVENHGGYSSNGQWISNIIRTVNMANCGTLPDFGNFSRNGDPWYDRYKGVEEMMPFARSVSAKVFEMDESGNCVETDFRKMLGIVKAAGYTGYIGIECEATRFSEDEGIRRTRTLLERAAASLE